MIVIALSWSVIKLTVAEGTQWVAFGVEGVMAIAWILLGMGDWRLVNRGFERVGWKLEDRY